MNAARRRLRGLYRHPRRCRRPPRRRHPAGRRLYREKSASSSTPKAACRRRHAPAFPPGDAREDWAILRALSAKLLARRSATIRWRPFARCCYAEFTRISWREIDRSRRARRRTIGARRWRLKRHAPRLRSVLPTRRSAISISPIRSHGLLGDGANVPSLLGRQPNRRLDGGRHDGTDTRSYHLTLEPTGFLGHHHRIRPRACCCSSCCWSSSPTCSTPTARSGRPCRCAAAPMWSGPWGLFQSFADLSEVRASRSRSSRPAPTRASSCWRRSCR